MLVKGLALKIAFKSAAAAVCLVPKADLRCYSATYSGWKILHEEYDHLVRAGCVLGRVR